MCDYSDVAIKRFIKFLIKENIATRNKKDKGKVNVKGLELNEKVQLCFGKNRNTIKAFDKFEMLKGFKYSFLYKAYNINYNDIDKFADNIDSINWNNIDIDKIDINMEKPIYWNMENQLIIKFHKIIDVIDVEDGKQTYIRYPIIVILHKVEELIEIRFDRLTHKRNEQFYELGVDTRISWLHSNLGINMKPYELTENLSYIVENCKEDVKEDICSLGYPGEKGIIVKYGDDNIMPFIGEIEELIKNNNVLFEKNEQTKICKEILETFIFEKKTFADTHYRELTWIKTPFYENNEEEKKKFLRIKVSFNYRGKMKDLITFYNSNNFDMERMNYVIKYMYKAIQNIE